MANPYPKRVVRVPRTPLPPHPAHLPPLPQRVRTRFGEMVDTTQSYWVFFRNPERRGVIQLNALSLDERVHRVERRQSGPVRLSVYAPDLAHLMRLYLAERLERFAPLSAQATLGTFLNLERYLHDTGYAGGRTRCFEACDLTLELFMGYSCPPRGAAQRGRHGSVLRQFYAWGRKHGFPGFQESVLKAIRRVKVKGTLKGHIVRFRHPTKGAFNWEEQVQIDQALKEGRGAAEDRALVELFRRLGLRCEAVVRLRRRHLKEVPAPGGVEMVLDVPRVKQHGSAGEEEVVRWTLGRRLGDLLLLLQPPAGDPEAPLVHWVCEGSPHLAITQSLRRWAEEADLRTVRTVEVPGQSGETQPAPVRLNVFPYRFRRALATNLAEQGATAEEIAAALDDRTLAMAAVYTENTSAIVDVLEETLDRHPEWTRVLRLFRGEVLMIPMEGFPEIFAGAAWLAGYEAFEDGDVIGRCADPEACVWEPPLACYQCDHFRALPDAAVHERQLVQLRREQAERLGHESDRMAGVLRRTTGAIVQLIAELEKDRQGAVARVLARIRSTPVRSVARAGEASSGSGDAG